jgi:hypothetical protein
MLVKQRYGIDAFEQTQAEGHHSEVLGVYFGLRLLEEPFVLGTTWAEWLVTSPLTTEVGPGGLVSRFENQDGFT